MNAPANVMTASNEPERKRAARRTALWLAVLAAAFYIGFIALSVVRSTH
jgi:hypothetical protein